MTGRIVVLLHGGDGFDRWRRREPPWPPLTVSGRPAPSRAGACRSRNRRERRLWQTPVAVTASAMIRAERSMMVVPLGEASGRLREGEEGAGPATCVSSGVGRRDVDAIGLGDREVGHDGRDHGEEDEAGVDGAPAPAARDVRLGRADRPSRRRAAASGCRRSRSRGSRRA